MYNLVVWLSVIIIALIVVFVAYAQVTNEIIKYYQEELKKEYEKGYKRGIEVLSQDDTTSINAVAGNLNAKANSIYTISGARIAKIQKGLNIVKMSNGSVKKIFVK